MFICGEMFARADVWKVQEQSGAVGGRIVVDSGWPQRPSTLNRDARMTQSSEEEDRGRDFLADSFSISGCFSPNLSFLLVFHSVPLLSSPLMYVLHIHVLLHPRRRDRLFVCSLACRLSFLGPLVPLCWSVGRSAACSWYHLPPPTTPANAAAAAAPTDGPRSTLGCVRAAAAAAYLGKIKDGGHESKHGQRRRRQRGQPSEGGKWRWAAAAAALVGRRCAEGDRGRTSETEGTKEEGRKRKSPHSLQPQSQHLKNRLLCYAKDNNGCDTKDRRRHKRGNNNDFIRSEIGSLEGMETKDGGDA